MVRFKNKYLYGKRSIKRKHQPENLFALLKIFPVSFNKVELDFLNKGLNFAPLAPRANLEEVVVGVESSIQQLRESSKGFVREAVRSQICKNISTCNPRGISDRQTIESLKEKDCFYLKSDKGNKVAISDEKYYFDRVDKLIEEVLYKKITKKLITKNSFRGSINELISSFLSERSVFGPLIYLLYINDLLQYISDGDIFLYADDTTILVTGETETSVKNKMLVALREFSQWCWKSRLIINFGKTLMIHFIRYIRKYVSANYNIAFGTTLTYCCSSCLPFKEQLKLTSSYYEKRSHLTTENRVHLMKAKAFFRLLKYPKPNTVLFSFDCQKNLALSRLPDQAAYFSQQINSYNFTVVSGRLTPAKFSKKNANTIASEVRHALNTHKFGHSVTKINLFADGCGGTNKSTTMMMMEQTVLVQGEINYCSNTGRPKGVCEKNCSISSTQPAEVPLSNKLEGDKTTIVGLLAAHYGEDWIKLPELAFYKIIKNGTGAEKDLWSAIRHCIRSSPIHAGLVLSFADETAIIYSDCTWKTLKLKVENDLARIFDSFMYLLIDSTMFLFGSNFKTDGIRYIVVRSYQLSTQVFILRQLSGCLDIDTLRIVYFSIFHSHLSYGTMLWGNSVAYNRIFVLQEKALRTLWDVYYLQFENIALMNNWLDEEKACALTSVLVIRDYGKITSALKLRFGDADPTELLHGQLHNRTQQGKDDLSTFADEIQSLESNDWLIQGPSFYIWMTIPKIYITVELQITACFDNQTVHRKQLGVVVDIICGKLSDREATTATRTNLNEPCLKEIHTKSSITKHANRIIKKQVSQLIQATESEFCKAFTDNTLLGGWIDRQYFMEWPACSPDFTSSDFLCGYLKQM
nr:unnamed protein product [Callosobruchus chinensis]